MKTLKSTGLVRRFGCGVVRETKTVLAVLAMLASVLAWGSAPVRAQDNDGDLGSHRVRVLAQNMYIGASLHDLITATTVKQIKDAITALSSAILATKPRERAAAMAAEIAKQRPDFVALSEAWKLTVDGVVKMDLLDFVIDELKALGQPYELARATVGGVVKDGFVNQEDLNAAHGPERDLDADRCRYCDHRRGASAVYGSYNSNLVYRTATSTTTTD